MIIGMDTQEMSNGLASKEKTHSSLGSNDKSLHATGYDLKTMDMHLSERLQCPLSASLVLVHNVSCAPVAFCLSRTSWCFERANQKSKLLKSYVEISWGVDGKYDVVRGSGFGCGKRRKSRARVA
jgi:hypothetical protein